MKVIYMRDVLKDLWEKKVIVIICLFVCIGVGINTGYNKVNFYDRISKSDKIRIENYNKTLKKYNQDVKETKESINQLSIKIKELQNYINNSIFMHLNPNAIYVANVHFSSPDTIDEADFLNNEYWSEVLNVSSEGNMYTISIMHYSKEHSLKIINKIVDILKEKHRILEPQITCYTKTDINILDKQKDCYNTLSSYSKNRADLNNRLKIQTSTATKYKTEGKPKVLSQKNLKPRSVIIRYALFGLVSGVLGIISVFSIRRILC